MADTIKLINQQEASVYSTWYLNKMIFFYLCSIYIYQVYQDETYQYTKVNMQTSQSTPFK